MKGIRDIDWISGSGAAAGHGTRAVPRMARSSIRAHLRGGPAVPVDKVPMATRLARDIEMLLNVKPRFLFGGSGDELRGSILGYGLMDPMSLSGTAQDQKEEMAAEIEDCLSRFEPRLASVIVTALLNDGKVDDVPTFRLSGRSIGFSGEEVELIIWFDPKTRRYFCGT